MWFSKPTSIKHLRDFGSKWYIKRDDDNLGKFDFRSDEGIFLGYSPNKNAYRCYNLRLHKIVESANVKIDDLKTKGVKTQDNSQSNERIRNGDEEENEEFQEEESQNEEGKEEEESQEKEEEESQNAEEKEEE